jgi:hypothetical protein
MPTVADAHTRMPHLESPIEKGVGSEGSCPGRSAACNGALQTRDPGSLKRTGTPRLRRITPCCAARGERIRA